MGKKFAVAAAYVSLWLISANACGEAIRTGGQEKPQRRISNSEVHRLLDVLQDQNLRRQRPEKVVQAIARIETLKPKRMDVIEALIGLLTFKRYYKWEKTGLLIHMVGRSERYPAVAALASIGRLSVPALLNVIAENKWQSVRGLEEANSSYNAFHTFLLIFLYKKEEGRRILADAIEAVEPDSLQRYRLLEMKRAYESFFSEDLKQ